MNQALSLNQNQLNVPSDENVKFYGDYDTSFQLTYN